MYRLNYKDRDGNTSTLAPEYVSKDAANARIFSISDAQRDNGAIHVSQFPGLARASWRDGSYVEIWRAAQITAL